MAVGSDTPASSAAFFTQYWRDHLCIRSSHFWRVIFDLAKKLLLRMLPAVLQSGHHQRQPSLIYLSDLSCSVNIVPHLHCCCLARTFFVYKKATMPGVPPKAIGPSYKRDMVPTLDFPAKHLYKLLLHMTYAGHQLTWLFPSEYASPVSHS